MQELLVILFAGASGALVKDILQDGRLMLPKRNGDALVLGFIGGMIIGAFTGWVVDGQPLTAGMGGYVGSSLLKSLVISSTHGNKREVL